MNADFNRQEIIDLAGLLTAKQHLEIHCVTALSTPDSPAQNLLDAVVTAYRAAQEHEAGDCSLCHGRSWLVLKVSVAREGRHGSVEVAPGVEVPFDLNAGLAPRIKGQKTVLCPHIKGLGLLKSGRANFGQSDD